MSSYLVTGATGTIGRALLAALGSARILSRNPERGVAVPGVERAYAWDGVGDVPDEALKGVDTVFHLAGEPVAEGRWTDEKKNRIRSSRELGTRSLVAALGRLTRPPRVLVSASAVGYYGSRGDEALTETSSPGGGFLAEVCQAWESEAAAAAELGVRVVSVRIGVVLSPTGGALEKMLPAFRWGVAGRLGDGKQWMPWVHVDDVVGCLRFAAENEAARGALNAASPNPVTNTDFTRALAKALHRPAFLPVPRAALAVAFGEMSEVLLGSQRVLPEATLALGYRFLFPRLDAALKDILIAPHGASSA